MIKQPDYEGLDRVDPDVWEQELAGEAAMQTVFFLIRRRLRELEQVEGFTQSKLADRMKLTRAQISRWFVSPSNLTLRNAAKLLMAMDRKLEFSLSDPFAVAQPANHPAFELDPAYAARGLRVPKRQTETSMSGAVEPALLGNVIVLADFARAKEAASVGGRSIAADEAATGSAVLRAAGPVAMKLAAKARADSEDRVSDERAPTSVKWLGEAKVAARALEFYYLNDEVVVRPEADAPLCALQLSEQLYALNPVAGVPGTFTAAGLKPGLVKTFLRNFAKNPSNASCDWI